MTAGIKFTDIGCSIEECDVAGAAETPLLLCAGHAEEAICPNCEQPRTGWNAAGPPTYCASCNADDGSG